MDKVQNSQRVFDSDAEVPGHRSKDANAMANFCNKTNVGYHCLSRRAIENYIPRKALWTWAMTAKGAQKRERTKKMEAFKRLNPTQQHHFRLKTGWDANPSAAVNALYTGVPTKDRHTLRSGIDTNIASLYEIYADFMYEWATEEGIDAGLQTAIDEITDWIRVPYA